MVVLAVIQGFEFNLVFKKRKDNVDSFYYPTEIFLRIADAIKDTGIRINFDTANNLAYGDETVSVLKKIIKRMKFSQIL